jgi:hypothetical protein
MLPDSDNPKTSLFACERRSRAASTATSDSHQDGKPLQKGRTIRQTRIAPHRSDAEELTEIFVGEPPALTTVRFSLAAEDLLESADNGVRLGSVWHLKQRKFFALRVPGGEKV